MGLIDKLREAFNPVKDPLADPEVKLYFEIICEMRRSFRKSGTEPTTGNVKAKRYLEHFLGKPCDQEKLQKTLELYNRSREDSPKDKEDKILSDFRQSLFEKSQIQPSVYFMEPFRALKLFCQEEIAEATLEYRKVLDFIKNNVNYKHFSQGMKSMNAKNAVKQIVVAKDFCDGNPIAHKLVMEYMFDSFIGRMNNPTFQSLYDFHDDIALLVLKASHFERYRGSQESYTTITDEDYRNLVLNVNYYKKIIEDHPFEQEECIERFVNDIKKREVIYSLYTSFGRDSFHIHSVDDYFCDAVSNSMWKEARESHRWLNEVGEDISNSTEYRYMFNIMCDYLQDLNDG